MKRMNMTIALLLSLAGLMATGCGPVKLSSGTPVEKTKALDGVKYISSAIGRGDDVRTYGQRRYTISGDARVLVRFESLSANQSVILTTQPIYLRVFAPDTAAQTSAIAHMRACSIIRDWMMAASWKSAHPYRGGEWRDGSDIEDDECVAPLDPATATGECAEPNAVCFNVASWYKRYVVERGINYGHALISDDATPLEILGDGSYSKGPRIQWFE